MIFKNHLSRGICLWIANQLFAYPKTTKDWETKNIWLRRAGLKIGRGASIGKGLFCLPMHEENIEVEGFVAIGYNAKLYAFNKIVIGSYSMIASDVIMTNGAHKIDNFAPYSRPLSIGKGCWIGTGVKIVGGLKIGNNVVIGAGSVVINDIPDNAIVVGIPGKIINYRNLPEKVWHFGDTWFSPESFKEMPSTE